MKSNLWVKTLLYIYKYLDRITDGIDKMVEKKAMSSFYYGNCHQCDNGTMTIVNKIISMIERKKRLINIKVLVDKCLLACEKEGAEILIERFIDDDSAEIVAERREMNIRTFFRRQVRAEGDFYSQMVRMGYDVIKLEEYLAEEGWIIDVYQRFCREIDEELALSV